MTHHLVGMAEIAEMLGVTRQRVGQLIESYDDFPKPEVELSGGRVWSRTAIETWIASHPERGPGRPEEGVARKGFFGRKFGGLFTRFTDRARSAVVKAQEEARLLNHNYIGTEHLLLGLIAIEEGLAYQVLAVQGVTLPAVRSQIDDMIGRGTSTPEGRIPFTPRGKKVLELALREALQLGHNYIGTEHVLLALIRETDGVAWKALERLGLENKAARDSVLNLMSGYDPAKADPAASGTKCSFCGKERSDVETIVAGPGVAICNECVVVSAGIIAEETAMPDPASVRTDFTPELGERIARLEERLAKLEEPPEV
jgi:predicted DNA-binding transcriptional regulator AlpA